MEKKNRWDSVQGIVAILAIVLSVAGLVVAGIQGSASNKINQRLVELEEQASQQKALEVLEVDIQSFGYYAYMEDSQYCYETQFENLEYGKHRYPERTVEIRLPLLVTIYNNSEQAITIRKASLVPSETNQPDWIGDHPFIPKEGFWGIVTEGKRENFSIPPGEAYTYKIDAFIMQAIHNEFNEFLRAHIKQVFDSYYDPRKITKLSGGYYSDSFVEGKGTHNELIDTMFQHGISNYCIEKDSQLMYEYTIETARGSQFSKTYFVP